VVFFDSLAESAELRERVVPAPVTAFYPDGAMRPAGVANFERFFRVVASLDVDKDDLKRYREFVTGKLDDQLIRGQAIAKANDRDVVQPFDLPITKGLQESIHDYRRVDGETELRPFLEPLAEHRPQDVVVSEETQARLPDVVGGLSVALARAFKIIEPDLKNPQTEQWERAFRIFDLLL
jgi:hypothetical protein